MSNINTTGISFDWDSEISNDSSFVLLPIGEYNYTVTNFERGRFPGSEKIPACNKAMLTLSIDYNGTSVPVKADLIMHSVMEWKLSEFFRSIGQKKHGEKLRMDWGKVIGSTGRCSIKHRTHNGNEYNDIDKFLDPTFAKDESAPF